MLLLIGPIEGVIAGGIKLFGGKVLASALRAQFHRPRRTARPVRLPDDEAARIWGGARDPHWRPISKCKNLTNIPVLEKTKSNNGLFYKSNPKHTLGALGNRPDAGIEPKNSLKLFEKSIVSNNKTNVRFVLDESTGILHRFFYDEIDTWHWSGATNQGVNSLTSTDIPIDIIRLFNLDRKGW